MMALTTTVLCSVSVRTRVALFSIAHNLLCCNKILHILHEFVCLFCELSGHTSIAVILVRIIVVNISSSAFCVMSLYAVK